MDYKNIITYELWLEKMQSKGYDFTDTSVLDGSHFQSQDEAIEDYFQDTFNTIYELVREYRGNKWTELFFEDMSQDVESDIEAARYKDALIKALIEQAVYIYDNGSVEASGEVNPDRHEYAPKAVKALWGLVIKG